MEQPPPEMTSAAFAEFPTTPDIARQGVAQYKDVLEEARGYPEALNFFLHAPDVARCFVGTTPEVGFVTGSLNLKDDLLIRIKMILQAHTKDFIVAQYDYYGDNGQQKTVHTLLNLVAAEHVIHNHADLFPEEASENTRQWLINNPQEVIKYINYPSRITEDTEMLAPRHGLLSGYSEWSSQNFVQYQKAKSKYKIYPGVLSKHQAKLATNYPYQATNPTVRKEMEQILNTPGIADAMTDEDKEIILTTYHIPGSKAQGSHFGSLLASTVAKDQMYMKQLDTLYEQSGIEKVIHKAQVKQFVDGLKTRLQNLLPTTSKPK